MLCCSSLPRAGLTERDQIHSNAKSVAYGVCGGNAECGTGSFLGLQAPASMHGQRIPTHNARSEERKGARREIGVLATQMDEQQVSVGFSATSAHCNVPPLAFPKTVQPSVDVEDCAQLLFSASLEEQHHRLRDHVSYSQAHASASIGTRPDTTSCSRLSSLMPDVSEQLVPPPD